LYDSQIVFAQALVWKKEQLSFESIRLSQSGYSAGSIILRFKGGMFIRAKVQGTRDKEKGTRFKVKGSRYKDIRAILKSQGKMIFWFIW